MNDHVLPLKSKMVRPRNRNVANANNQDVLSCKCRCFTACYASELTLEVEFVILFC